ncbi:MAG: YdiU family protein [Acetobacteraceae bacterium]|nr:YdiU family protein [Acetobacteraceae bacterium]
MPLDHASPQILFDNSYGRLPDRFFAHQLPVPVPDPRIVRINVDLAARLGIDPAALDADFLAGNRIAAGSTPIAQAYSGHQFGHFSPLLGDGRAVLLGEIVAPGGQRFDLQLKGSGRTRFSRGGDGRAALGPVLREYILGEGMHGLGIPTTRALAAVTTGQAVQRETALPGAVLARVAASHLRVGTFQYFASQNDEEGVRILADYAIARHYPDCAGDYPAFLRAVVARQAELVASWLLVGFIHGVMNTDNVSISGETIDYGPCAFMDQYDPATVFSSIDHAGRYAYGRQPRIAGWNLARFAETLLPLLAPAQEDAIEIAKAAIAGFGERFETAYLGGLRRKIGLETERDGDGDDDLTQDLLRHMQEGAADWTLTFRALADAADGNDEPVRALFSPAAAFDAWAPAWHARLAAEPCPDRARAMRAVNPLYIPRNHLVEAALSAATQDANYAPFEQLLDVLARPFEERPGLERFTLPPRPEERVLATFCGT